ncbi:response regulator transcription factor [Aquabacterium sp.]|uniref:response regulator transcription factor n=1 Tax=Aquabacterium sp. TaxID=1872578 RepID=UPI002D1430C0|nr:response regulator transcription factor [Aquabacterium sp.]HSW03160.1 response regulator transcription factor [Aquabacterium sp.]
MKVLLIDDDSLILSALQAVVRGLGEDVTVVGVDGPADAHKLLQHESDFDLVLLDLVFGEGKGFEVLGTMRRRFPGLPVVVLSDTERVAEVVRTIDMGAMGYVPKRSPKFDLRGALSMVMAGGVYIPPALLGLVRVARAEEPGDTVPSVMRPGGPDEPAANDAEAAAPAIDIDPSAAVAAEAAAPYLPPRAAPNFDSLGLTPRQREVLALLLRGLPNKLIARELNLSVDTVKDHVAAVLRALGVSSRTQAVLAVSQITLVEQGMPGWRAPDR